MPLAFHLFYLPLFVLFPSQSRLLWVSFLASLPCLRPSLDLPVPSTLYTSSLLHLISCFFPISLLRPLIDLNASKNGTQASVTDFTI